MGNRSGKFICQSGFLISFGEQRERGNRRFPSARLIADMVIYTINFCDRYTSIL